MKTRSVKIGSIIIGGGAPVAVQSMCNTKTKDVKATIEQIKRLTDLGCEIIRCGVPDMESALALDKIKSKIKIPLVADIHYDYKLAIASFKSGADKIRINPGNIGSQEKVKAIIDAAKEHKAAIRIGVNAGSLKTNATYHMTVSSGIEKVDKMVSSLMEHVEFFEKNDFKNIVVSLKAHDVPETLAAYRLFNKLRDYPLHIGITEAGTSLSGTIKSSVGLGILLNEGLGDTMRVSLTADPEEEIYAAYKILSTLGLRRVGVELISCPTCARTEINVIKLAKEVEKMTKNIKKPLKIAVMGCSVNGPGEAKEADLGVSGGRGIGLIFKGGEIIKRVPKKNLLKEFEKELKKLIKPKK
ncbi:MAG: flavodoxin-dependent (E)-4-hydroxy-3-methylbut-2-enyl-diphosphate synthase [bacterium]